jgi:hypothetical protein
MNGEMQAVRQDELGGPPSRVFVHRPDRLDHGKVVLTFTARLRERSDKLVLYGGPARPASRSLRAGLSRPFRQHRS